MAGVALDPTTALNVNGGTEFYVVRNNSKRVSGKETGIQNKGEISLPQYQGYTLCKILFLGGGGGGRVGGKIENEDAAVGNKKGGGEEEKYPTLRKHIKKGEGKFLENCLKSKVP